MNTKPTFFSAALRYLLAMICTIALLPGDALAYASFARFAQAPSPQEQSAKIPPEQMDSLVAPIALYPDSLLAQALVASTYPLELVQLQQWLAKNPGLKDQALADAVAKQPWDPSIQALAGLPEVVKRLTETISWTTDLGNAFLAQQGDVMDAVQRMRKKAQDKGTFKSTEQQTVETRVIENKSVIVVEQANPQVVYVPSYDPVVVYGQPVYPYPYYPYPYYPVGYYAAGMAISFGIGLAMGAWWGGGWGCGWGNNNININNNNNFVRNSNVGANRPSQLPSGGGNRGNIGGGRGNSASQLPAGGGRGDNNWKHNPQHRGGTPYRDRATADRFGGNTRGDSLANRQSGARQQLGRQGGNVSRPGGGAGLGSGPGVSNRASGAGVGNRAGGGPNSIGGRDLSRGGGGNRDAFGGGSRGSKGFNGSNARASGNRGASSAGSRGGGMSRGGGGGGRRR
jgi:Protein of unknown function (DUF3300)